MSHGQWDVTKSGVIELSGDLDRDSTSNLWLVIQQWKPTENAVSVSLEKVNRVDSAGMVLLIHLIEHAKNNNCHIMFDFVPAKLRTLFQLSNVESIVAQHLKNESGADFG
ncbi:STAS domain-containing protein [Vibrio sp. RC27]